MDIIKLIVEETKKKLNLKLNPENKGLFKEYCGGKVTCECIKKGLTDPNPVWHNRAIFAYNFGFKRNGHKCPEVDKIIEEHKKKRSENK